MERIESGIPGMDRILSGGFVKGGVYLLLGPPGTGKTIFANQMCFHHAHNKTGNVVYVTLLAESHGRMMENLRPLNYFHDKDISNSIHYMGGYHVLEKEGLKGFLRLIAGIVKEKNASILMIDGMSTISELEQSAITFRKFAHELNSYLSASGCTAFLLSSNEGHLSRPEHTMVDGIVSFHYTLEGVRAYRELEVRKFRGSSHLYGKHTYKISEKGITVFPRLESVPQNARLSAVKEKRLAFKIKGFDEMMEGGIISNTVMTFLGGAGTGKTSFALQFLAAGALKGEKGLFFGFYETPDDLIKKSGHLSINIDECVKNKSVELNWHPALEYELDELGSELLDAVKRTGAKRVVLDGVEGLKTMSANPERIKRFVTALMLELKRLDATVVLVEESSSFGIHERQLSEMSAINESVIFFQLVDMGIEIMNTLTILKMRNTHFDKTTREIIFSKKGISVDASILSPLTVLTNKTKPRVNAESRIKKAAKKIKISVARGRK